MPTDKAVSYTHLDVYKRQMQILHWLKINVFKVVVLMGTFALALAFEMCIRDSLPPTAGYSSTIR